MIGNLLISVNSVVPFAFYIAFGYFSRRAGITNESMLISFNKVAFQLFYPFLTFYNLYQADFSNLQSVRMLLFCPIFLIALTGFLLWLVPKLVRENSRRGVVIITIGRCNTLMLGLPLAFAVCGDAIALGITLVTSIISVVSNALNVFVYSLFDQQDTEKRSFSLLHFIRNPLIIGLIIGLLFQLLRLKLPQCLLTPVSAISAMASPLALFILGGSLMLSDMRDNRRCLAWICLIKLLLLPAFALALAWLVGIRGMDLFCVLIVFGTPTAASSYSLAQAMNQDAALNSEIVVLTTVLSIFSLFVWVFLFKSAGLV